MAQTCHSISRRAVSDLLWRQQFGDRAGGGATGGRLSLATTYSANFEGRNIRITGSLHSTGIEPATNVSVSFEVPEPMEVVAGTLSQGTCAIENLRKITCTRATLAPGAPADLTVDVRSSEPGTFIGHFSRDRDQRWIARQQHR